VFSGFAIKPKEALTEQELLHAVAKTSGAIGYIEKKTLIEGISYVEVYE